MSNEVRVTCSKCGAEQSYSQDAVQPFYCASCGAVLSSPLGDGGRDASAPGNRFSKYLVVSIPIIVLFAWFGYLWFVSGVLPSVQKYDNGEKKALGYVKRTGLVTYQRTGHWVTFHPNGEKSGEGEYKDGEKVPGSWHYWDAAGQPSATPVGEE